MVLSIFSCAYNISVSSSYSAPLLITIRPNNNTMEPVKHAHTWAHKQYTIDRLLCFTEQTHKENCKWNHSENGSNTHRKREGGWERRIICSGLSQIGPFTYCRHCVAFPLAEEAVGLSLVLMATVCLTCHYCAASVTIEKDSGLWYGSVLYSEIDEKICGKRSCE